MDEEAAWVENAKRILLSDKENIQFAVDYRTYITGPLKSNSELIKSWGKVQPTFLKALEVQSTYVGLFLWTLTDTFSCVLQCIPENTIRPIIEYFWTAIDEWQYDYWIQAVSVINNLAMMESAREEIRSCGATDKLLFMRDEAKRLINAEKMETIITTALALLMGHIENNPVLTVDNNMILGVIEVLTERRTQSKEKSGGYLWEVLMPLVSLAKADQNKELIAKYHKEIFACVTGDDNFMDFTEDERTRRTIWQVIEQLSFLKSMQNAIRSDKPLMAQLQKWAKEDKSAVGILWSIQQTDEVIQAEIDDVKNEEKDTHIMISYTWKYQDLAKKINQYLQERNFKVWIDIEQMSGNTLEAMAHAVEGSSLVIILVSEAYKNSVNCRREGDYIAALKKPFIPVLCADGYKADGWLGILLGTDLWYNLSTTELWEQNIKSLEKQIRSHVTSKSSVTRCDKVTELEILPFPSRSFAKPYEVEKWLEKVGVTDSVLKSARNLGLDGAWYHCYQDVAKSCSIDEFCRISKEFFPDMTMVDVFKLRGWMIS